MEVDDVEPTSTVKAPRFEVKKVRVKRGVKEIVERRCIVVMGYTGG